MSRTVQVERDAESFRFGLVAPARDPGIVPTRFGVTHALGRRAVKVVQDQRLNRRRPATLGACRRREDVDAKRTFVRYAGCEHGTRREYQRPAVQGPARLMWRDVVGVESDGGVTRPHEHVHRDRRHAEHT